jgi:hypothetical protein
MDSPVAKYFKALLSNISQGLDICSPLFSSNCRSLSKGKSLTQCYQLRIKKIYNVSKLILNGVGPPAWSIQDGRKEK